jgi:folate-binding protein YgfZ
MANAMSEATAVNATNAASATANATASATNGAAARSSVLAVRSDDRATLVVTGGDRASWLNGLLTSDLARLDATGSGEASYGLFVARNGRIVADALVLFDEGRALVSVPRETVAPLRVHLDHYLVMEDAEIAEDAEQFATWMLHGPASDEVLLAVRAAVGPAAVGARIDRTGLGGAILFADRGHEAEVRAAIERAVAERGGVVADDGAWEWVRIERGVPRFGADFDDKVYPQEAGLEKAAVSFNKGCYLGQEVVCMLELRGHVKRKLAGLAIDASEAPARGTLVSDEAGAAVGEITSAAMSPLSGKPVALAMLKRANVTPGSRLVVAGAGARVVELPVTHR